jgi:hypothetical protein
MSRKFSTALLGLLASVSPMLAQAPFVLQKRNEVLIVAEPAMIQPVNAAPPARGPATAAPTAVSPTATTPADVAGPPIVPTLVEPDDVFWSAPPLPVHDSTPACATVWFGADYLLWWARQAHVAAPLVTTGSPLDPVPGALGQPHTAVLFGNQNLDFGAFSGFRVRLGVDLAEGWGVEAGYFGLETRAVGRSFNSDIAGNPVIARPYFDNQAGAQAAYLDALPGVLTGGAAVAYMTQLFGYEANVAAIAYKDESMRFDILAGFRALELHDELRITDNVAAQVPGVLTFTGTPADPPNSLTIIDRFHNYNRFYGGQVGGRFHWSMNGLELGITGKLALGATQELARVDGATNLFLPGGSPGPLQASNAGGILAQPSNSTFPEACRFAWVPELAIDVGYWVCSYVRLEVGYQLLYWSQVARPGDEIDFTVNPAQVPRDPRFGNGLGDARPAFQFRQSDYWAQGFRFSVLFQY